MPVSDNSRAPFMDDQAPRSRSCSHGRPELAQASRFDEKFRGAAGHDRSIAERRSRRRCRVRARTEPARDLGDDRLRSKPLLEEVRPARAGRFSQDPGAGGPEEDGSEQAEDAEKSAGVPHRRCYALREHWFIRQNHSTVTSSSKGNQRVLKNTRQWLQDVIS